MQKINKSKPAAAKGRYIKNGALSLTMSPAITLDTSELLDIQIEPKAWGITFNAHCFMLGH